MPSRNARTKLPFISLYPLHTYEVQAFRERKMFEMTLE